MRALVCQDGAYDQGRDESDQVVDGNHRCVMQEFVTSDRLLDLGRKHPSNREADEPSSEEEAQVHAPGMSERDPGECRDDQSATHDQDPIEPEHVEHDPRSPRSPENLRTTVVAHLKSFQTFSRYANILTYKRLFVNSFIYRQSLHLRVHQTTKLEESTVCLLSHQ